MWYAFLLLLIYKKVQFEMSNQYFESIVLIYIYVTMYKLDTSNCVQDAVNYHK